MNPLALNEEKLETEIRKFLKKVGVTSHQAMDAAVREALRTGTLDGEGPLQARMTLDVPALGMQFVVDGEIRLN